MLVLKDCDLQPGDIIFLVSSNNSPTSRIKKIVQAFTGKDRKHGHMEVISVFVCTGGDGKQDSFGFQFHNYEQQLRVSERKFINTLYERAPEELSDILKGYCTRKELPANKIKSSLLGSNNQWMRELAILIKEEDSATQILEKMIHAAEQPDKMSQKFGLEHEKRSKLIDLILFCWNTSGHAQILPSVNSSLLVFRHNDPQIRDQFLAEYMKQVEVTKAYKAQGKTRTSMWRLFVSLFRSSAQDKYDKDRSLQPADETFCAQNVIQTLNKVDPNLVDRGRYVTPKSLEAGMRAATKPKVVPTENTITDNAQTNSYQKELEPEDEFEALLAETEKQNPLPPFKLIILPKSGKALIKDLSDAIENEITRIQTKFWKTKQDLQKAADLEKQLAPFKALRHQNYTVSMQVEASLAFLHQTIPILQRKTGWFGAWISSTSYANIREFARQQGIFDGDLRDYAERLKNSPIQTQTIGPVESHTQTIDPEKSLTYLFSDWSFSCWSIEKRASVLNHMLQLMDAGHALYLWNGKEKRLVPISDKTQLSEIINQADFDNLWSDKVEPITQKQLLEHATQQNLNVPKIKLLDYRACNTLAQQESPLPPLLNDAAKLFTEDFNPGSLKKTKLKMLRVEIENATGDEAALAKLRNVQAQIESEQEPTQKYRSGVDTRAPVALNQHRKPIFKSVDLMTITPSSRYYRNEVYANLVINKKPTSSFDYFELEGMSDFSDLQSAEYTFHSDDLTDQLIKNRKKTTDAPLFLGECSLTLTQEWQALPSLSRGETLLDLAVENAKKNNFEIHHSKKNGLYFIRQRDPEAANKPISIKFLLEMPKGYSSIPTFSTISPMPKHEKIHQLLMKYYNFGKDAGLLDQAVESGKVRNGEEYLDEARRLKVGSCRLRAIAFKDEMSMLYPEVPVAIDVNSDHCFVEMELDGQWQRYCLGGYRNVPTLMDTIKKDCCTSLETFTAKENSGSKHHSFFKSPTTNITAPIPASSKHDNLRP